MHPFVFAVLFIPFHDFSDFFCSDSFHCGIFDKFLDTAAVKYVIIVTILVIITIINFYKITKIVRAF